MARARSTNLAVEIPRTGFGVVVARVQQHRHMEIAVADMADNRGSQPRGEHILVSG